MEEAMIKVPQSWIVQGDFEPESGYRAMQQILSQSHRPTAVSVVAISWQWAHFVLLMKWSARAADVSLIGYDNARNARYFTPARDHDPSAKRFAGETAFNMLLDRIVNKREEPQSIEVHPRLIERRPWLTARSATIVSNHPVAGVSSGSAANPYSASHYRRDTQATRLTQATYHFAAMSDNMPNPGRGFSSSSATHFPH